jgi:long-subunit fatty acid transport protein
LQYGGTRASAMGVAGVALSGANAINSYNPAGLSQIQITRFAGDFSDTHYSSQDVNGSATYNVAAFQGVAFAFPIAHDYGIALSLELNPISSVRYGINYNTTDTIYGERQISIYGKGGLSSLSLGLSYSPFTALQTGIKVNYIYGRIEQYQNVTFTNSDLSSDEFDRSAYYSGVNFTIGLLYHGFQDIFDRPALAPLTVGFVFSNASTFNVDEQRTYTSVDTTNTISGTSTFPYTLGLGLSYTWNDRYLLSGDVVFQNWGSSKYFDADRVDILSDGQLAKIKNSTRVGLGVEIAPLHDASTYFSNIIYRFGVTYNSTYYNIGGNTIDEYDINGGLGIPIGPDTRLNVGLQFGVRGTLTDNLVKDTFLRLSVGISASELWFFKIEEEQ